MGAIRELADKLLAGEVSVRDRHPFYPTGEIEEVAAGVAFMRWFANITAVKSEEGLVLIDTGNHAVQEQSLALLRKYSPLRVNTAIYTHGHIDHVGGMPALIAEAQRNHAARPRIVGNRAVGPRFERYQRTAGYNSCINTRQFSRPVQFPTEYVFPDTWYDSQLTIDAGGIKFECHHGRGETDDATWVYVPARKVLLTGDFFIWCAPNAGNPQKVQRYAREWADAMRAMAKCSAEVLVPGHGLPIFGARNVRAALTDTADYLQSLYDQAIALMNQGAPLDELIHSIKPPAQLIDKPYVQPIYDEPEFIVRNIWRLEGGWYDGVPSHLKPAPEAAQGREICELAGGVERVIARALERLGAGELAIACHLIDWAVAVTPADKRVHEARAKIYTARADSSPSTMSHGIFRSAAIDSAKIAGIEPPKEIRGL